MANGDGVAENAGNEEEKKAAENKKNSKSVVPGFEITVASSARNPLDRMIEIATHPDLSDLDKATLIMYARSNFKNRRKMAYICLWSIIISFALLFAAAFNDGILHSKILAAISDNQTIFVSIEGFLTSIVGAYYGVSAWRPSS